VTGPAPKHARTPRRSLYRIGRPPDPLAWPPHAAIGHDRFDDPLRQYRVLYAAAQRAGCFAETLAAFRPSLASFAAERGVLNVAESPRTAQVPAAWWSNRLVGTFTLSGPPGSIWARSPRSGLGIQPEPIQGEAREGQSRLYGAGHRGVGIITAPAKASPMPGPRGPRRSKPHERRFTLVRKYPSSKEPGCRLPS
jgi:RES domain